MREMLAENEHCDRPKHEGVSRNNCEEERERFGSIEEASSFWRGLWEGEGTGNSHAVWLDEVRHAIFSKVPPPTDEDWTLETAEAVGVLKRKKNWSAPGPDRLVNFWWKRTHAHALHQGVARSFEAIWRIDDDIMVTLDCQRRRRNLTMAWVDVKKAYDSVDHGWLGEMMVLHRFPKWLCEVICKLCNNWNTRIVANTLHGQAEPIVFKKGLPQGDALCPRLFTICLNPVAWRISASKGYKRSKPISARVTDLLYIDDLKVFAASESKLNRVLESTQAAMEDIGLQWNPRKCAVVDIRRGVHSQESFGRAIVGERVPTLEEGRQYKFLGVFETLAQEEKMALELAAKEYLRRLSVIWSSPPSDYNRVVASNQFALPVLGYLMWT